MAFCSSLAFLLVWALKVVEPINITPKDYLRRIVPIAFLFAVVLWMGNTAYLYLSVAFIQMVKALMPCIVYAVGVLQNVENHTWRKLANMITITVGVAIASYGELNFNLTGFLLLLGSLGCEAARLVSIQVLLTSEDVKLNSITTLYYVSPACFGFLVVPFLYIEAPRLFSDAVYKALHPAVLLSNAALAFMLNVSVYLLIGRTSALTMNVAGVIKDWMLIFVSSIVFVAPISILQLSGYLLAFLAVGYYNYTKLLDKLPTKSMKGNTQV